MNQKLKVWRGKTTGSHKRTVHQFELATLNLQFENIKKDNIKYRNIDTTMGTGLTKLKTKLNYTYHLKLFMDETADNFGGIVELANSIELANTV